MTCKPITQTWTDVVTNLAVLSGRAIYPGVSPLCACMAGPLGAGRRGVEPLVGGAPPSPSCRYTHSQRCAVCILYVHWHSVPGHAIFEQYLINFVFNFIITFFLAHIFMKIQISQDHFCLSEFFLLLTKNGLKSHDTVPLILDTNTKYDVGMGQLVGQPAQ